MNDPPSEVFPESSPALAALAKGLVKPRSARRQSLCYPGALVAGDAALRATPDDPASWAADLKQQFSPAELVATGCFVAGPSGEADLVQSLQTSQQPLLVLRQAEGWSAYDVIGSEAVAPGHPHLELLLLEWETRFRLQQTGGALIATADLAEALAFRQLGLPAAPVSDLARCGRQRQQDVADLLWRVLPPDARLLPPDPAVPSAKPPKGSSLRRLKAVLVTPAWDPLTLALKPGDSALAVAQMLLDVERDADADLGGVGLWTPSQRTLDEIQARALAGRPAELIEILIDSLASDARLVDRDGAEPDGRGAVRHALEPPSAHGPPGPAAELQFRASARAYRQRANEQLIPLRESARNSDNPVAAALLGSLADAQSLYTDLVIEQTAESPGAGIAANGEAWKRRYQTLVLQHKLFAAIDRQSRAKHS